MSPGTMGRVVVTSEPAVAADLVELLRSRGYEVEVEVDIVEASAEADRGGTIVHAQPVSDVLISAAAGVALQELVSAVKAATSHWKRASEAAEAAGLPVPQRTFTLVDEDGRVVDRLRI